MNINHDDLIHCVERCRNNTAVADRAPLRAQLAADVEAFLARGGVIEHPEIRRIHVERAQQPCGAWSLRYREPPPPITDRERVQAVQRRRRTANQRLILPGSHCGPRP